MAEHIEEPEAEASAAGVAAGDGAAAALALTLGKARPGARLPPEAAAFLERQSRFVELQMEHLHEQRELALSRLRWGRFSDRMKAAIQVLTGLVGLVLVVVIGAMAWGAHADHGVRIEAFSAPPDLAQRGLTGQVVASQLLDDLAALQAKTVTGRPASSYANDWGGDIKVEIPETGVSLGEVNRYLREWLGSETRISGEVVRTAEGVAVTARAGAKPGATFRGPDADLDGLMQRAAEAIYAQTQPYRWAMYLASSGRTAEAMAALETLARSGAREDRVWAYSAWARMLRDEGRYREAVDAAGAALALDSGMLPAKIALASSTHELGRLEQSLQAARSIVSDLRAGQGRGVAEEDRANTLQASLGQEALATGDYRAAAALLAQSALVVEGRALDFRVLGAQALASNHDVTGARQILGSIRQTAPLFEAFVALEDWGAVAALSDGIRDQPPRLPMAATAYARNGRLAEARALIAAAPLDSLWRLLALGQVAAVTHDWPAVDRWFAEAARQAPSSPLAQAAWGQALLDKGDIDGAVARLKAAHRISPHFADPIELWGEALMRKGDLNGALAKFAEADKYAPKWGRNHQRWGETLMLGGRYAEARRQFEAANGLDLSKPDRAALDVLLARTASGPLHG